jgi:hypothetical protein
MQGHTSLDPTMDKIFPQRCSTHGCNLLVADVGKLFQWEILFCVRLVKFVSNHDGIFAIMMAMPNALVLLGAVETRFASQIYSSERIIEDKGALKVLFYGAPLREYLNRSPAAQLAEYRALEEEFISNAATWERISIFVDVELPLRKLLRTSDGHQPKLIEISFGFEEASRESLVAAAAAAAARYPDYHDLTEKITTILEKRKKDIVTPLCLAVCMVHPSHVYTKDNAPIYEPEGGRDAISTVIYRYCAGDIVKQIEALKCYQDFRSKSGYFGSDKADHLAKKDTSDSFWKIAGHIQPKGSELFRKLCNGYAGQGESERMNKQVKKFRTTLRNRQAHVVTIAYMELDTVYKMEKKNLDYNRKEKCMICLRDKIMQIEEEVLKNALLAEDEENLDDLDEIIPANEFDDAEYNAEIDDQGINALMLLLNVAEQIEE